MGSSYNPMSSVLVHYSKMIAAFSAALDTFDGHELAKRLEVENPHCQTCCDSYEPKEGKLCEVLADYHFEGSSNGLDALSLLKEIDSRAEFENWLDMLFLSEMTGYEYEREIEQRQLLDVVVWEIAGMCEIELPDFEIRVIENMDVQGLNTDERGSSDDPWFFFNEDCLFTQALTPLGEALAAHLKQDLYISRWTQYF